MAWAPKSSFSGIMEDVVIPSVKAIIVRDFKEALDYYFPTPSPLSGTAGLDYALPNFNEISLGQIKRKEFPCLAIGPIDNRPIESQDSARFTQPIRIALYVGVVADSDEAVTKLIMRYVKVMYGVLLSANKGDFFANITPPTYTFGWWIGLNHSYGPLGANKSQLFRPARLELSINFESR